MQLTWKTLPCGLPPRSPKAPSTGGKHPRVLSYACKPQQPACGTINIFLKKGKGKKNEKIKRNISYNEINGKHSFMFCFPGKGIFFLAQMSANAKFQMFLISFIIITATSSQHFLFVCILRNLQELVALFHPFHM